MIVVGRPTDPCCFIVMCQQYCQWMTIVLFSVTYRCMLWKYAIVIFTYKYAGIQ